MDTFWKKILGLFLITTMYTYSFASEKPTLKNIQQKKYKKRKTEKIEKVARIVTEVLEIKEELQEESENWRKESKEWRKTTNELPGKLSAIVDEKVTVFSSIVDNKLKQLKQTVDKVSANKMRNSGLILISAGLAAGIVLIWFYFVMEEKNHEKKLKLQVKVHS